MDSILANSWSDRRPDGYDAVVVGSGYGGAITAARLANAAVSPKLSVCILERGQEWPVGEFPDNLGDILGNAYSALNPLGLYEFDEIGRASCRERVYVSVVAGLWLMKDVAEVWSLTMVADLW